MSAFVVSKDHIDALVTVALYGPRDGESQWHGINWAKHDPRTITDWRDQVWVKPCQAGMAELRKSDSEVTADELGFILWAENVASVSWRYPDDTPETLPGTMVQTDQGMVAECTQGYTFERVARRPSTVEALKLISCLEYQSCEHDGWIDSEAYRVVSALKDALIGQLVGMSAAAWEFSR